MEQEYSAFKEEIRSLIRQEVMNILKENNVCRLRSGIIDNQSDNEYDVDTVTTRIPNLLNKTGDTLQIGDTVSIIDDFNNNYANCAIMMKHGQNRDTLQDLRNKIEELETRIEKLEGGTK